ncbi:MAG: hypothetical protein WB770_11275 [Acidimicrobiales bacterium]
MTVHTVRGLGPILADGAGYTLYAYVPDHQGKSRCFGECAAVWPPFLVPNGVGRAVAGPGVRDQFLGSIRRSGGSVQVTYRGWPLYLYRDDHAAGEVTGQGDDMGLWFTMSPGGTLDLRPVPNQAGG